MSDSDIVIKAEGLGKSYIIGHNAPKEQYRTLRDVAAKSIKGVIKKTADLFKGNAIIGGDIMDEFWALKNLDFEIKRGDAVGIIGRNGAGKSTLLKILSRITEPTLGKVTITGRVASLLEVGTGFHPELSGRDNIFLNGAILGMSRVEIRSKFDEIVDFAGVERFLDTPVKKYSSGMYVRLAFAVAAHLEPDILIVDEVLAVGDAEFQKKCLGKMEMVSKNEGRTVLFVSHNMGAIQSLCNRCMFLDKGFLVAPPDTTNTILNKYMSYMNTNILTVPIAERRDREGEGTIRITDIKVLDKDREEIGTLISGQKIIFSLKFYNTIDTFKGETLEIALSISRLAGALVTVLSSKYLNENIRNNKKVNKVDFIIEKNPLMSGNYSMNVMIRKNDTIQDWIIEAKTFDVENGDYYNTGLNIPESHNSIYVDYSIQNS